MPISPLGMASYAYTAINSAGLELDGQVNAPDANSAREALRVRGLVALKLDETAASPQGAARGGGLGWSRRTRAHAAPDVARPPAPPRPRRTAPGSPPPPPRPGPGGG